MLFDQDIAIPEILSSGGVTVSLLDEKSRYNLRIKRTDLAAIKKASGLKLPPKIGQSSLSKDVKCFCLGPDEWVVEITAAQKGKWDKAFSKISQKFICSITDISHRNVAYEIKGEGAVKLINVGCPLDLSLDTFPIGKVARTVFESTSVVLLRREENTFQLECWRSFGPYLRDYFARVMTTNM